MAARSMPGRGRRLRTIYGSLYLNMDRPHELLGEQAEAERFYALAAALGAVHQPDGAN